jgi:acyl-CoA thioester hydrolase
MTFNTRVYYSDTDAGGVVYYANYLVFCEKGRTELLRERGLDIVDLSENIGLSFVVKSANMEYLKSAKLDDILAINTKIISNNRIVIHMEQSIFNDKNELLFIMNVNLVLINKKRLPVRIPIDIYEKIKE